MVGKGALRTDKIRRVHYVMSHLLVGLLLVPLPFAGSFRRAPIARTVHSRRSLPSAVGAPPLAAPGVGEPSGGCAQSTVIVGAGPTGLATSIMLARRGWTDIHVYDRLGPPPEPDDDQIWSDTARFYLVGLGGRGQRALAAIDAWEEVRKYTNTVTGRKDWSPESDPKEGVERRFTDRKYLTEVIARDRLVGALYRLAREKYPTAITFHHNLECTAVRWDAAGDEAHAAFAPTAKDGASLAAASPECREVATEFLIGADGSARTIANEAASVTRHIKVTRYVDDNQRVYKTVPLKLPEGWSCDLNYSARTKDGRVNFDALPANDRGDYCGVLLMRASDPLAAPRTSAVELRELLDDALPQFSELLDDGEVAVIASKAPSTLPFFRYVGPRLHVGSSTLLLGDAVHTVKPYFGLGANSAFEDVQALDQTMDDVERSRPTADRKALLRQVLPEYSRRRAGEAKTLVRISRSLDRPGALGLLTFILPLVLDGIFGKLLPWLFAPNVIALLQKENYTFQQIARRKRMDRAVQAAIISSVLLSAAWATQLVLGAIARTVIGRRVLAGASAIAVAGLGSRLLAILRPAARLSPGDVLAKLSRVDNVSTLMRQRMSQRGYGTKTEPAGATASGPESE